MPTVDMTDENYQKMIAETETLVVDCWATWCAPCRKTTPVFVKMSDEHANDNFVFAKLDTQNNQDASSMLKILSLPTFLVFKKGELVNRWTGADVGKLRKEIKALSE